MKPTKVGAGVASFFKTKKGAAKTAGDASGGGPGNATPSFGDLGVPAGLFDGAASGWDDARPGGVDLLGEEGDAPLPPAGAAREDAREGGGGGGAPAAAGTGGAAATSAAAAAPRALTKHVV